MSIQKKIHEAIEASRAASDLTINEDPGHLHIAGCLPYQTMQAWQTVADERCDWLTLDCIDESQDRVAPKDIRDGERVRLSIKFTSPFGTPHLFTPEGWHFLLCNDAVLSQVSTVRLAFIEAGFLTKAFAVEPWLGEPSDASPSVNKGEGGPRRHVRSQSPDFMPPSGIEPWVLSEASSNGDQAFSIWCNVAVQAIARSLPNELYRDGQLDRVMLSGQPPRRLDLGAVEQATMPFDALQEAASWVYLEAADVEVRHTFLSSELAREWKLDTPFYAGLPSRLQSSLDSARLIYKAHLRAGSKDTLKSLGDLRKTLADEVQKLLQQSRDLSTAVWRDVAVAVGVIAIRFAMDSVKSGGVSPGFALIYLVAALYIGVSYWITIGTNKRFLAIFEETRQAWRPKLYAFLDDEDYKALAEKPVSDAMGAYHKTRRLSTIVVSVVIALLLICAGIEIQWINVESMLNVGSRTPTQSSEWVEVRL
jgi:hypothetical protein